MRTGHRGIRGARRRSRRALESRGSSHDILETQYESAAKIAQDTHPQIDTAHGTLNSEVMFETATRLRAAAMRPENFRDANAAALAKAFDCWRDREFPKRRETVAQIASAWSYTAALLDESLDALLEPFRTSALRSFGARVPPRRDVIGFIMPGNVPGAGLHEFSTALLAGSGLIVKTSPAELP